MFLASFQNLSELQSSAFLQRMGQKIALNRTILKHFFIRNNRKNRSIRIKPVLWRPKCMQISTQEPLTKQPMVEPVILLKATQSEFISMRLDAGNVKNPDRRLARVLVYSEPQPSAFSLPS
jgi:hypothetical protein